MAENRSDTLEHCKTMNMGIKEIVDSGLHAVPPLYVRPPHDRPVLPLPGQAPRIPVIDLAHFHDAAARATLIQELRSACQEWGFFQVINHGIEAALIQNLQKAALKFFMQPAEEKMTLFTQNFNKSVFYSPSFTLSKGKVREWRDALSFLRFPGVFDGFQDSPDICKLLLLPQSRGVTLGEGPETNSGKQKREVISGGMSVKQRQMLGYQGLMVFQRTTAIEPYQTGRMRCSCRSFKNEVQEYVREVETLAEKLYRAIFESIGLDDKYIEDEVPAIPRLIMAINYFPPCPDPTLTLGLSGHTDINCLTVLHPGDVPGLQIKHKGNWVPVFPVDATAFVINLADQFEIFTNGKYKSIEHRVVTNPDKPRMSIACFFGPIEDTIVAPLSKLLSENNPSLYKPTLFKEYVTNFLATGLEGTLDFARV